MSFFNLGKKDEYGRQQRIEHRGKYLRASRTGGVSLRAQTRAAGLSLTASSGQGFRVSRTVGKNTQMAMQNGRFVLRGRYGSGPTRLNLSKTGMTVSTRNQLGTFNWIRPGRSSARLFGVQVRGSNAAWAHAAYLSLSAVLVLLQVMFVVAGLLLQWAWQALLLLRQLLLATPYGLEVVRRRYRNWQIRRARVHLPEAMTGILQAWPELRIVAAAVLAFAAWGRGREPRTELPRLTQALAAADAADELRGCRSHLAGVAESLSQWRHAAAELDDPLSVLALTAALAEVAAQELPEQHLPDTLLRIDDLVLQEGPRTRLQEQMVAVFCDFAGLRLQEVSADTPPA